MVAALSDCRDSARRAREILTTSSWKAINRAYRKVASGRLELLRPPPACRDGHDHCSRIIGAQQSFVMSRGQEDTLTTSVDFLLRDRLCPRSIIFCLDGARDCLSALDPTTLRSGFGDDDQIEYMQPNEAMDQLGELTQLVQETGAAATQALSRRYFEGALSATWHEK